jgi:hypothetical protein
MTFWNRAVAWVIAIIFGIPILLALAIAALKGTQ